jgi:hypothetical protein
MLTIAGIKVSTPPEVGKYCSNLMNALLQMVLVVIAIANIYCKNIPL